MRRPLVWILSFLEESQFENITSILIYYCLQKKCFIKRYTLHVKKKVDEKKLKSKKELILSIL